MGRCWPLGDVVWRAGGSSWVVCSASTACHTRLSALHRGPRPSCHHRLEFEQTAATALLLLIGVVWLRTLGLGAALPPGSSHGIFPLLLFSLPRRRFFSIDSLGRSSSPILPHLVVLLCSPVPSTSPFSDLESTSPSILFGHPRHLVVLLCSPVPPGAPFLSSFYHLQGHTTEPHISPWFVYFRGCLFSRITLTYIN